MTDIVVPRVTLEGIPVGLWRRSGWTFSVGTQPVTREVYLREAQARSILKDALDSTVTLEIEVPGAPLLSVSSLYVVALAPTERAGFLGLVLADVRWTWMRKHVSKLFNLRTKSGVRRRGGNRSVDPRQIQPIIDDLDFKDSSIKPDSTPWTALEAVAEVMAQIGTPHRFASEAGAASVPIIELTIDAAGPTALQQVLAFLPGTDVWIDTDGTAVFQNCLDGSEKQLLEGLPKPIWDTTLPLQQDISRTRPRSVRALWTPEIEVRFDGFDDDGLFTGTQQPRSLDDDPLLLANVVAVPDAQLVVAGGTGGSRTVVPGTYLEVVEYLGAINADKRPCQQSRDLVLSMIRITYMAPNQYHAILNPAQFGADAVFSARFQAILESYRLQWQIQRRVRMLLHDWSPIRVSVMDIETGNRGQGSVYGDWSVFYSTVGRAQHKDVRFYQNYPGEPLPVLSNGLVAPCAVTLEDKDLGVFRLRFVLDDAGRHRTVYPGHLIGIRDSASSERRTEARARSNAAAAGAGSKAMVEAAAQAAGDSNPVPDPREQVADGKGGLFDQAQLGAYFHFAVVLTVVPAVPNSAARLHAVEVLPEEIQDLLPNKRPAGEAHGPSMDVRVLPSIDTARFGWDDTTAHRAAWVEGLQASPPHLPDPPGLLVNEKIVEAYSKALAASVYTSFLDRTEGAHVTTWAPRTRPRGNARQVILDVGPDPNDGSGCPATTSVVCPPELMSIDPMAMVPEPVRAALLREVIRGD